ncbi:MAG: sel1 repeat family protein [Cephaloticoccus sp.]|nr:sel1 repeat family protein [Cephaloticoccus sp.]MCF7761065.1 sel1 repeat family protein [Cephaloticoccus sp.]
MRIPLYLAILLLGAVHVGAAESWKSADYIKYEKMAEAGDGTAMVTIGLYYHQGEGVQQDYRKAAEWYLKAIAAGNADAFNNLGVLFRDGNGLPQNRKLAYLIFLTIHMEGMGDEETVMRANRNLRKIIDTTSDAERGEALSYTWPYVLQLVMSLGADTEIRDSVLPTTELPRIRDNDWWLDSERARMTFESPPPWDKIKAAEQASQPITTDQQAIEAAMLLLQRHQADWGPVTRVLRTGSDWFRLEFAHGTDQAERVVLVDPATGEASFPMPR